MRPPLSLIATLGLATCEAATVTFSPSNTAVDDVWICANPPQQSGIYGSLDHMWVGNYAPSDYNRALIRFNVSTLANNYSSVQSVTLQLGIQFAVGSNTVELYQPNAANANWSESSSWDYKVNGGSPVAWNGGEGLGSTGFGPLLASATFTQSTAGIFSFTISDAEMAKAVIDSFVAGTNPGFLLKTFNETGAPQNFIRFSSSEISSGFRPTLIVNYSPVPEATGALVGILFITAALRRKRDFVKPGLMPWGERQSCHTR